MVAASPTFESILIDALSRQHGGRARLRQLGDEDLFRARLALRRCEVLWEDALAEYGPERAVTFLLAVSLARATLEEEESRRERARYRGVPRDPAAGWIPDELIAAIKARIDLADLIARWGLTDLRRVRDGVYLGQCPWHEDGTPSFYVYTADTADQHFHCFGCQCHGDLFDVARLHGQWLSFAEAVEGFAGLAGVDWTPPAPREIAAPDSPSRAATVARRGKRAAFFPR